MVIPFEVRNQESIPKIGEIRTARELGYKNTEKYNGAHSATHSKGYRDGFQKGYEDGKRQAMKELKLGA